MVSCLLELEGLAYKYTYIFTNVIFTTRDHSDGLLLCVAVALVYLSLVFSGAVLVLLAVIIIIVYVIFVSSDLVVCVGMVMLFL